MLSRDDSIIARLVLPAISNRLFGLPVGAAVALAAAMGLIGGCTRPVPTERAPAGGPVSAAEPSAAQSAARSAASPVEGGTAAAAPEVTPLPLSASERADGPHEIPLAAGRSVYYARPGAGPQPWRLVGHLHGICYPPSYSCGRWLGAATDVGVLVCPTGNARCGDADVGPPSWEAPSWEELVTIMDGDLERSIATVEAKHRGSISREGAILTGFSRGAYAAPVLARMHPGRWPFLVLIEANVPLSAASLRKAGVRAVALVAGEVGTEIAGERKTAKELVQSGFPARLFVMPRVAHLYSDDMERIMKEALAFLLSHEHG